MNTNSPPRPRPKASERKSRFSTPVDDEAMEFIGAIQTFRESKGRGFPAWTEVLAVLKSLGYRKVAERTELPTPESDAGDPD